MGAAKELFALKAEATPVAPLLIRLAPIAEAVLHCAGRPGAVVNVAINDRTAVVIGAIVPMAPLLRRQEARASPVGGECLEVTLVGNATSI